MKRIDLKKLRQLRKSRGLTQEDMAKALKYKTPTGYHYLEAGRCRITAEKLAIIADLLGVDIDELYIAESTDTVEIVQQTA